MDILKKNIIMLTELATKRVPNLSDINVPSNNLYKGLSDKLSKIIMLNPVTPIINNFRYAILGCGSMDYKYWIISWIFTLIVLFLTFGVGKWIKKTNEITANEKRDCCRRELDAIARTYRDPANKIYDIYMKNEEFINNYNYYI